MSATHCTWCNKPLRRSQYRESGRQKSCTQCSAEAGMHVFYVVDDDFDGAHRKVAGGEEWRPHARCETCRGVQEDGDGARCDGVELYRDVYDALDDLLWVRLGGRRVRWLRPLGSNHEGLLWLEGMSSAAWGYLEDCGWSEVMDEAPPFRDGSGKVSRGYMRSLVRASEKLAEAGLAAGPEGEAGIWLSWLVHSLAAPSGEVERGLGA